MCACVCVASWRAGAYQSHTDGANFDSVDPFSICSFKEKEYWWGKSEGSNKNIHFSSGLGSHIHTTKPLCFIIYYKALVVALFCRQLLMNISLLVVVVNPVDIFQDFPEASLNQIHRSH